MAEKINRLTLFHGSDVPLNCKSSEEVICSKARELFSNEAPNSFECSAAKFGTFKGVWRASLENNSLAFEQITLIHY